MPYKDKNVRNALARAKYAASMELRAREAARYLAWYFANREKAKASRKAWRDRNPAKVRAMHRAWAETSPIFRPHKTAHEARREARKLNQLCACCTTGEIRDLYALARRTQKEVDHIQPLALGGLHCMKNLQLLTPDEHLEKTKVDISRISALAKSCISTRVPS